MTLLRRLRLLVLLAAVAACGESSPTDSGPVATTLTLTPSSATLTSLGESLQVGAVVADQNGAPMAGVLVTWLSDDPTAVSVTGAGLMTAVAPGSATITASFDALSATVAADVAQAAAVVTPSSDSVDLAPPGDTLRVMAVVTDAGGAFVATPTVTWQTDDPTVATVSNSGLVTAVAVGTTDLTVEATGASGQAVSAEVNVTVSHAPLAVTTTQLPATLDGAGYSETLAAIGGDGSYTWSLLSGALPTGLGLAADGTISGTASGLGTASFTVQVESGDGQTATQPLTIGVFDPLQITTTTLPDAVEGAAYNELVSASGGDGTYTWAIVGGALPVGLSLSASTGFITGATSALGTANFTVEATSGDGQTATRGLSILVATCSSTADTDGDRLDDCAETNTGIFVSVDDTGTDPNVADTDGDGISDGDEVLGSQGGLDLPALGASPLRKDILVEYDWFDDVLECGAHSHQPTAAIASRVTAAFNNAPVLNPDGSTGINFIHDYGQGGVFTGGNLISDANGVLDDGVSGAEYLGYKGANFAANRHGYFRYVILPHNYNTNSGSSGQAEVVGDDMIVSLQCAAQITDPVANTIVHELGHNLGLRHGGFESTNWKPNYNSVMNYKYQFPGTDFNCTPEGDGVLAFSDGSLPPLDENDLDETQGLCGTPPGPAWDWNGDGDEIDVGLSFDITVDGGGTGDGILEVLTDHDDWSALNFSGLNDGDGAPFGTLIVECQELEEEGPPP